MRYHSHLVVSTCLNSIIDVRYVADSKPLFLLCTERLNGKVILGRIIVHDRVTVESKVLPRYFNHSSFASLRRQLNYFSFVRLGKGRQRESTYINEHVVDIDDILHLKRRPAGSTVTAPEEVLVPQETVETCARTTVKDDSKTPVLSSNFIPIEELSFEPSRHRPKRCRLNRKPITESLPNMTLPKMLPQRSFSPVNHFVSEDEHSEGKQFIALDLTKPVPQLTDDDVLAGCSALLELSAQRWS